MSSQSSLAVVIRLVEFSESSYVTTLFTETHGKITGLAKGARRAKSAFANALDLLAISRVLFLTKTSGAMELLTEAKLERRFRAGQHDLTRLYAGYYVAELLNALTDERDPHSDLFRTAVRTLVALDESGDVGQQVLRFELAVLQSVGQLPALHRCVECGVAIERAGRVAFGQLAGGALCPACRPGQRHVVSLSRRAVQRLLESIRQLEPNDRSPLDMEALSRVSHAARIGKRIDANEINPGSGVEKAAGAERAVRAELRGLMTRRMSHLLGRQSKMHSFLTMLR